MEVKMNLKKGVEIFHKNKQYVGEIPDAVFKEIYGKRADKAKVKYQLEKPKRKAK
jgi:hypothetical protein